MPTWTPVRAAVFRPATPRTGPPDLTVAGLMRAVVVPGDPLTGVTHVLKVPLNADVRDATGEIGAAGDVVRVPESAGTEYAVLAVTRERTSRLCHLRRLARPAGAFTPS